MKQKQTANLIYHLTMFRSKSVMTRSLGEDFWKEFKRLSDERFAELMNEFEDIGDSMFAFNYIYAPGYVAWYSSMKKLGLDAHARDVWMLRMNEQMLLTVPKFLLHAVGKTYYRNMSNQAAKRMQNPPKQLHKYDWDIDYRKIDEDRFEIDIKSCGFIAYAKKYDCEDMLPGICQVDYMISHYMNVGFDRTETLGAGGRRCDCKYSMNGTCSFDIEKRLAERR